MLGRLARTAGLVVCCLALALVLGQGLALWHAWSHGRISRDKLVQMLAVAYDLDLVQVQRAADLAAQGADRAEPSLDDLARQRALASRDLELRELSLHSQLTLLQTERAGLTEERAELERLRQTFQTELTQLREEVLSANQETARSALESLKPAQAKDQLLRMVEAGEENAVVQMLAAMAPARRAKILAEFKTADEAEQLAKLLKLLREGVPELPLIDQTQSQLPGAAAN